MKSEKINGKGLDLVFKISVAVAVFTILCGVVYFTSDIGGIPTEEVPYVEGKELPLEQVSYVVNDTEYQFEDLSSVVTEPVLATKIVTHEDGSCDYSDVYITFSETVSTPTVRDMDGKETILLVREDK